MMFRLKFLEGGNRKMCQSNYTLLYWGK